MTYAHLSGNFPQQQAEFFNSATPAQCAQRMYQKDPSGSILDSVFTLCVDNMRNSNLPLARREEIMNFAEAVRLQLVEKITPMQDSSVFKQKVIATAKEYFTMRNGIGALRAQEAERARLAEVQRQQEQLNRALKESLESALIKASADKTRADGEIDLLKVELQTEKDKSRKLELSLHATNQLLEDAQRKIASLMEKEKATQAEIADLRRQLEEARQLIICTVNPNPELLRKLEETKAKLQETEARFEEMMKKLTTELQSEKEKVKKTELSLHATEDVLKDTQRKLEELSKKDKVSAEEIADLRKQIEELKRTHCGEGDALRRELDEAKRRLRATEDKLDDMKGRLDESEGARENAEKTIADLEGQIRDLEAQVARLRKKLDRTQFDLKISRENYTYAEGGRKHLLDVVRQLELEIQRLEEQAGIASNNSSSSSSNSNSGKK